MSGAIVTGRLIVAVVGTGSMGRRHLNTLHALGVPAIAVPERPERRRELEADGSRTAVDLAAAKELGARAAVVATETARHVAGTQTALSLGLPVLCEKPMAMEASEASALASASKVHHLPLFVACCLRFDSGLQLFRERLPDVGDLHSVRIECRSYLPEWRPGRDYRETYAARGPVHGILLDLVHEVDYASWCFGMPKTVMGRLAATKRLGISGAEAAEAVWSTPSADLVSVGLDYLTRGRVRFVRVEGERGGMTYDFIKQALTRIDMEGAVRREVVGGGRDEMYSNQMIAFLNAVDGREPGPLATAAEGVGALSVCEAWARSAASDREETVR